MSGATPGASLNAEEKTVLFLSGERGNLPSVRELEQSVRQTFHASTAPEVELFPEYLDFARFPAEQHAANDVNYLRDRYAGKKIDLVMTVTGFALEFAIAHREELFPGVPIVFFAADEREVPKGQLPPDVTGIVGHFDIERTAQLIFTLQPGVSEIVCVGGTSAFDRRWEEETRKVLERFGDRARVRWITDESLEDTVRDVTQVGPQSAVFYISMQQDGAGHFMTALDSAADICRASKAPVYGFSSHFFEAGTVGGAVFDFAKNGKSAANLALRVLRGEWVPFGSPELEIHNPLAVNSAALKRWRLPQSRVPAEAELRNKTPNLWERERPWILAVAGIVLLQAALIAGLVAQRLRRRKAESSLRESEQRFRSTADAAPLLIWMSGPDKLCTFFNKAWLGFTGRSMEQELGHGWIEGVHPEDVDRVVKIYEFAFQDREPFTMQYRLRRYDGEYRWLTDNGVPRHDAQHNFLGYIGACIDITNLREKERALHEFEQRVALAADAAQLGVWELNTATNHLWVSDKVCELFQFKPDAQVTNTEFQERVHPEDRAAREATMQNALRTKGTYETEYRIVLPDGTVRWIAGRTRCVNDGDGTPWRLLGVSMDVTERKQAEELFHLATEASPSGTLLVNDQGRIVLVNAHIEELFGYRRDELIGKPVDLLAPERFRPDFATYRANFRAAPQARAVGGHELFGRRKDGGEFPVEIGVNPIDTPHGILVLASVVDISSRKAAEEEGRQRRQQVELLSRVSLLGEMTASLAHELNQPLSAIVTNANAGMRFIDKEKIDPEQLREILADVADSGRRANDIIHNVRSAIRKGSAIRGRINLNDVVKSVAHLVAPDAAVHSCKVEMSLKENLPVIEGDPTQIQQALINLVRNAFDAMSETPAHRRVVQIDTQHNGNGMICVGVRDHGSGIAPSARERLFEQFFTTKEDGLGLGLAIVRSIIEEHGGKIAAENVDGGGARFYFNLPTSNGI